MKKMKLVIAAAAVLTAYAGLAQIATAEVSPAKNPQRENVTCRYAAGKPMNADYRLEMMTNRLGLSEDQKAKIKPILDENVKQKQAVRADKNLTRDQRRAKMQELRAKLHDQIKPILTPEQNSKVAGMWTATADLWKGRNGYGKPGHRGKDFRMNPDTHLARMTSCLGLSADQQAKIKPILEENFKEKQSVHADKNLTRDQRWAKMQELRVKFQDQIKPLLTPEQNTKFAGMWAATAHHWKGNKGHGKPGHYGKHFRMDPDAHLARMTSCMGLSADQQAKIKPILEENFTQKKAVRADKNLTRDQRRAKMQELRVQLHEKVKPLLTQEQLKQYEAWKGAATHHPKCWNCPLMK
jgi:Spy/CpxP family protein refolding chaperone